MRSLLTRLPHPRSTCLVSFNLCLDCIQTLAMTFHEKSSSLSFKVFICVSMVNFSFKSIIQSINLFQGFRKKKLIEQNKLKIGDMLADINNEPVNTENVYKTLKTSIHLNGIITLKFIAPIKYVDLNINRRLLDEKFISEISKNNGQIRVNKIKAESKSTRVIKGNRIKSNIKKPQENLFMFVMILSLYKNRMTKHTPKDKVSN
jgi:hypothetical protein